MFYLSKLKRQKKNNKPLLVADIETDCNGELLDVGYYDGIEFLTFQDWESFIDFLPSGSQVWFHNGGKFDAVNAVSKLSNTLAWSASIAGSSIVRLEFKTKQITFTDSACLLLSSLDNLSKCFNVSDKKIGIDDQYKSNMGEFKTIFEIEYYQYLKNDCLSLYQILIIFGELLNDLFGLTALPITIASTAMKIWRFNFLENDIYIPNERQDEFVRKGYYGGRVEYTGYGVTKKGLYHNCTMIDVNSMYPSVMLENYPIGQYYNVRDSTHFERILKEKRGVVPYGIYNVKFSIPDNIRHSPFIASTGKNGFDFGWNSENAYLTHEDLLLITELKGSYEVLSGYYVAETAPIFKKYVKRLYEIKSDSSNDKALILIAKILLNSLYGKLGQKNTREEVFNLSLYDETELQRLVDKFNERTGAGIKDFFEVGLTEFFNEPRILSEDENYIIMSQKIHTPQSRQVSNPMIAAYVTARARRKLWEAMMVHDTIYVDTDSLLTQSPINVPISKKLGEWGLEKENVIADVRGKKSYTLFDNELAVLKSRSKGFKKFDEKEVNLINKKFFSGKNNNPTGFKTWCRKNHINPSKFNETTRINSRQWSTREKIENPLEFEKYNDFIKQQRKKM